MNSLWSQIITGSFTLATALSITLLNDYLATKKEQKMTGKQKAIKLYALLDKPIRSLSAKIVIVQNILKDAKFDYSKLLQESDNTLSVLEEIEILVIENFYDLNEYFFELMRAVNSWDLYLLAVITGSVVGIKPEDFNNETKNRNNEIIKLQTNLKDEIINRYIKPNAKRQENGSSCNLIQHLKNFFKCKKA
ncbi:hypothetical protein SDA16_02605 [Legionella pneumophila serogroup 1]|uniref:hypothetical protein n=1 Tax=Legionella pneumophila TaxID=446 RepID=UPI0007782398|nr:hypothetical protein [Legionella pneumophila]HCC3235089.1 hypothetical protein [Legionella pneumophila subsp. pneumophila]HAT8621160.1 hypothetical protein [Legionella pneumophila]HAU3903543.1 hypothetical protein [Legionella pneumophila]HAU3906287.1 hypothetical protein [Legionella pneumophila]HAU3909772.1 hypothetical protein [Legionella pneumophila]